MNHFPHDTSVIYLISITADISQVNLNRAFRDRVSFLKEAVYSAIYHPTFTSGVCIKPRLCSRHLLRLENPCCNARFTILLLNIFINMPSAQNRSNFPFRWGFSILMTMPTA